MTEAERLLWKALRNSKLNGIKFRRQFPVGKFILDFCAASINLAVEIDGPIHNASIQRDTERTAILEQLGYHVIRFSNNEVIDNLPAVLEAITSAVEDLLAAPSNPGSIP
jgi:very-short-patch-repair endonuclease